MGASSPMREVNGIKVCGVGDGKGQQAGGKGACGSYGEKSRPPNDKGGNTGSALGHGGTARPRPRKQADEGGSFGTPATTDFKTEHNQAAPTGIGELRVGTLFCPACFSQRCSSGAASPATGHTGRSKRRDQCSVNGQLRASPQRQAIGDHLDAALIMTVCLEVQVSHQDVCGDSGTSLTADPGSCTFERSTPCPENTRPGAGSDVVTNSIKRTPTAASCRPDGAAVLGRGTIVEAEECARQTVRGGQLCREAAAKRPVCHRARATTRAEFRAGPREFASAWRRTAAHRKEYRAGVCHVMKAPGQGPRTKASAVPDGGLVNIEAQASVTSKVVLETTDKMQHMLGGSKDGDIIEVSQHAFLKVFTELTLKDPLAQRLRLGADVEWWRLAATRRMTDDPTSIQASTIAKGILVWTSLLDGASELLRECARDLRLCKQGRDINERLRRRRPTRRKCDVATRRLTERGGDRLGRRQGRRARQQRSADVSCTIHPFAPLTTIRCAGTRAVSLPQAACEQREASTVFSDDIVEVPSGNELQLLADFTSTFCDDPALRPTHDLTVFTAFSAPPLTLGKPQAGAVLFPDKAGQAFARADATVGSRTKATIGPRERHKALRKYVNHARDFSEKAVTASSDTCSVQSYKGVVVGGERGSGELCRQGSNTQKSGAAPSTQQTLGKLRSPAPRAARPVTLDAVILAERLQTHVLCARATAALANPRQECRSRARGGRRLRGTAVSVQDCSVRTKRAAANLARARMVGKQSPQDAQQATGAASTAERTPRNTILQGEMCEALRQQRHAPAQKLLSLQAT
ncbi:hypothetical protein AK812_SmicGene42457 [Symbiodinium microadriaticum]|uniref:Uncharacterized protein n=1 Tax=Symbiodinium microadriaticum TaxID=2951 RepID=A0A1Q9C3I6_SYMMI|nr:hypothetical protein AK812_SmicGene42457 [Symbiodinium microadriaticum]